MTSTADRIAGCLKGVATGDAIGKQTEMLSREDLLRWYPQGIRGFEGTPNDVIPRYTGNSKRRWRIGETTDDTERTVAVARAIIAERNVSHATIGREMLGCLKSVHPGVQSLWEFHQAGDPMRIAKAHDGCGAAIRVAPVGIFYTSDRLDDLVTGAREASVSTHGGSLAIAAAAATAAAVSAAIDGASSHDVLELAERAAAHAESRWPGGPALAFANAIRIVHDDLMRSFGGPDKARPADLFGGPDKARPADLPVLRPADVASCCFPNQPMTIVPLALGLATIMHSAEEAILLAANIGGDSDSVGSIAGGILGAIYPNTVNHAWYEVVERINDHNLVTIASALGRLRH